VRRVALSSFRTLLALVVVFGLGWGAAFGAGTVFGRSMGGPSGVTVVNPPDGAGGGQGFMAGGGAAGTAAANAAGGAGQPGARGQGEASARDATARRGTLGVVQRVGDDRLTLRGPNGDVTILLRPGTVVQKPAEGTRADVREGMTVLVTGQRGSNGDIEATSIIVLPSETTAVDGRRSEPSRP
jgi:hypothetical protein